MGTMEEPFNYQIFILLLDRLFIAELTLFFRQQELRCEMVGVRDRNQVFLFCF